MTKRIWFLIYPLCLVFIWTMAGHNACASDPIILQGLPEARHPGLDEAGHRRALSDREPGDPEDRDRHKFLDQCEARLSPIWALRSGKPGFSRRDF